MLLDTTDLLFDPDVVAAELTVLLLCPHLPQDMPNMALLDPPEQPLRLFVAEGPDHSAVVLAPTEHRARELLARVGRRDPSPALREVALTTEGVVGVWPPERR